MERTRIDLISEIVPINKSVIVVKQDEELYLVDTDRKPKAADTVLLPDGKVHIYDPASMNGSAQGVVYAAIRFLLIAVFCIA